MYENNSYGGVGMILSQSLNGGQELLCIETNKVYDWILNEASFDLNLSGLALPINPNNGAQLECADIDLNTVTCAISPADINPIEIVGREDQVFEMNGDVVTLQIVTIRKNFDVTLFVNLNQSLGGNRVEVDTVTFTRCEQVILCAPEGTEVSVTYEDVSCFVCHTTCDPQSTTEVNELDAAVTVRICQSIQSTHPVTIEVIAEFCQPRDAIDLPPCPAPTIPLQCPVVFPTNSLPITDQEEVMEEELLEESIDEVLDKGEELSQETHIDNE